MRGFGKRTRSSYGDDWQLALADANEPARPATQVSLANLFGWRKARKRRHRHRSSRNRSLRAQRVMHVHVAIALWGISGLLLKGARVDATRLAALCVVVARYHLARAGGSRDDLERIATDVVDKTRRLALRRSGHARVSTLERLPAVWRRRVESIVARHERNWAFAWGDLVQGVAEPWGDGTAQPTEGPRHAAAIIYMKQVAKRIVRDDAWLREALKVAAAG